jgi:hypothetical protein
MGGYYRSEAHLPAASRSVALIQHLPGRRRTWRAWAIFLGLIVLNETRGTYVLAQFLAAFLKTYHAR